ncbi:MAG: tripartite tricarboxylate transporter substrate binding protein [Pseudomonadota bacterium]
MQALKALDLPGTKNMTDTSWRLNRRHLLATAVASVAPAARHANAQPSTVKWPGTRPVSIVVPYSVGVPADILANRVKNQLAEITGGVFIAEHKPGVATTIGASYVARQPSDGYTFLVGSVTTFCLVPWAYKRPGYDPTRDFTHISLLGDPIMVLVANPRWKSLDHFLGQAKLRPGGLAFASLGRGGSIHLFFEDLMARAGVALTHVPYGGAPPAIVDTVGGSIDVSLVAVSTAKPLIDSGRVVALGIAREARAPVLPQVPTLSEAGLPGLRASTWLSLHARAGTPEPIVKTVEDAVKTTMSSADGIAQLQGLSMAPMELGRSALTRRIAEDTTNFRQLMARAGVEPQ